MSLLHQDRLILLQTESCYSGHTAVTCVFVVKVLTVVNVSVDLRRGTHNKHDSVASCDSVGDGVRVLLCSHSRCVHMSALVPRPLLLIVHGHCCFAVAS